MRELKRSLRHGSHAAELEPAFRAELSYTYELNTMGQASVRHSTFVKGDRQSFDQPSQRIDI